MVLNPAASIDGRLRERAAGVFAGRVGELALFDAVLAPPLPAVSLLWIHGPGGIGKSTLLTQLRERAEAGGRRTALVDAALLAPAVAAFEAALGAEHPLFAGEPGVLFIDSAEALTPLQGWLRREFLPAMPATWLVVLANRHPPPAHWTVDAGWQGLMQVHPLAPLSDPESRMLLARRGVPEAEQPALLRWARGLPLALALLADTRLAGACGHDRLRDADATNATPTPMPQSEVVQSLVRRFTQEAASPAVLSALQVAALSRHTTQALLADVLDPEHAVGAFDALRRLSFVRADPWGLALHELLRDVLVADTLWREAAQAHRVVRAIYRHHYGRMVATTGAERIHHQSEALYTQRHAEHKSRFFAWDELSQHRVAPAREADLPLLRAIVRRHEGEPALPWLDHWWQRQREGFRLFWRGDGDERCDGFLLMLRLGAGTPPADRADPAVAAAWRFIGTQGPLAAGEEFVLLRHWMHAERHQAVTAAINLASMHVVSHLISQPGVAWSVVWMADAAFWQPHFDSVNFARCPAADYTLGAHRHGAFVHDWRFEPPAAWVAGEYRPMPFLQAGAIDGDAMDAGTQAPDGEAFAEAVRQALRDATDAQALGRGALARQLGMDGDALQAHLRAAVIALGTHPREAKFRDALWHTYIEPMHKQEQVAAELGIPFPTYRYRLQQGVGRLTARLRQPPA
jgi:hypothetical protein